MFSPRFTQPLRSRGFSLVELLIVIAIVGILSLLVIPGYSQQLSKVRRADAHHLLLSNAQILQRCLTLAGTYNGGCGVVTTSRDGYYALTTSLTARSYTLTATPVVGEGQAGDAACTSLTLTNVGHKGATGSDPDACW